MNKIILCCFFMSLILPKCALGKEAKAQVTVNGSVIARPCIIVNKNQSVNLGNIFTYNMNPYSEWVDFKIILNNCPDGTNDVKALFTGGYNINQEYFINNGSAKNVGIQVRYDDNNELVKSGDYKSIPVTDSKEAIFNLSARAIKLGDATTGTLQSTINITYTWL